MARCCLILLVSVMLMACSPVGGKTSVEPGILRMHVSETTSKGSYVALAYSSAGKTVYLGGVLLP